MILPIAPAWFNLFFCRVADINNTLKISFAVGNDSDIHSLEHVVVKVSLSIENYTVSYSLVQYHIMQTLFGVHFQEKDIENLLWHTGARRGDIQISLISPHGTESVLLPYRENDFVNSDSLEWSFMSVLHWGENPRGRWSVVVNFKSGEGYVQMLGLNVTFYGISEDSVVSVAEDCSPQCRGKCAKSNSSDSCDACWYYRDAESLMCMDYCDNSSYELYQNYCIPLQVRGDHIASSTNRNLIPDPTIVSPTGCTISHAAYTSSFPTSQYTREKDITPTETQPSHSSPTSDSPLSFIGDMTVTRYSKTHPTHWPRITPSAVPVNVVTAPPTSSTPPSHRTTIAGSTLWSTTVIAFLSLLFHQ